jgi:hypothetical protein
MVLAAIFALVTSGFVVQYLRELWYWRFKRDKLETIAKKMRSGEFGGEEMSHGARLSTGYPLLILLGALFSIGFYWQAIEQ